MSQEIQQRTLAIIEGHIVEGVEYPSITQRAQLRVDPPSPEDQPAVRCDRTKRPSHPERAINIARKWSGHGHNIRPVFGDQLASDLIERRINEGRIASKRVMQEIECGGTGGQPLAVAGQLKSRVNANSPHISEVVDVQARQITRLLRRAQGAEGGEQLLAGAEMLKARAFRKIGSTHDAKSEAGIAPLEKANRRFNRVGVALSVVQKVSDRRRH